MGSRRRFLSAAAATLLGAPLLLGQQRYARRSWRDMVAADDPIVDAPQTPDPAGWPDSTITAAWIGHATVFINFFGLRIITDPVFSERIGLNVAGLFTLGPRRLVRAAIPIERLPPLDLILLSHAHMDHLDTPSIRKLDKSVPVIMAKNTYDVIDDFGFETVYELDWGKWTQIGGLRVEALEVKHFGWRYPWEQDRSRGNPDGRSYNAYLLSYRNHHIVFGGDTAYQEHFLSLRERGVQVDCAILPIGAYDPWIHNHANPEQALAMADQMGARHLLPIHWNTFVQSQEPTAEPMERLKRAAEARPDMIAFDTIGQTWTLPPEIAIPPDAIHAASPPVDY
jgi:L-ascorbate metabolism protein UlaG (beta-lactamase superfamily)